MIPTPQRCAELAPWGGGRRSVRFWTTADELVGAQGAALVGFDADNAIVLPHLINGHTFPACDKAILSLRRRALDYDRRE